MACLTYIVLTCLDADTLELIAASGAHPACVRIVEFVCLLAVQESQQQMQALQHQLAQRRNRVAALEQAVAELQAAADEVNEAALLLLHTLWLSYRP